MRPSYLLLHCSDTEDGPDLSWPAIRRYHVDVRGWSDIGYHYGIERQGSRIVALQGRHPMDEGAHCRSAGRNHDSLGICVVGVFEQSVPDDIYHATVDFLTRLAWTFHITPGHVTGHREWDTHGKTCPGMAWDLDKLRRDVRAKMFNIDMPSHRRGIVLVPAGDEL